MSDQSQIVNGRRRVPAPPLPTVAGAPLPIVPSGGLQASAAPFVPGAGLGGGYSSASGAGGASTGVGTPTMKKMLSATASSWQPKSASAGSSPVLPNDVDHNAVKAATASIDESVAKAKAAASKMRAHAEAFTPTKSDGGSFPTSPEKKTDGAPSGTASRNASPPSLGKAGGSLPPLPPPPPPPMPAAAALPDPFKASQLAVPAKVEAPAAVPLNMSWTLYAESKNWGPTLGGAAPAVDTFEPIKVGAVADVEAFWRMQRSVPTPASRVPRFTYYFFRKSIVPSWEEPRNKNGGIFSFVVWDGTRVAGYDRDAINDIWLLVLLGLVGETLDESMCVNGVSLKLRRVITIEFWCSCTAQKQLAKLVDSLRALLRDRLPAFPARLLEKVDFNSMVTLEAKSSGVASPGKKSAGPDFTL